MDDVMLTTVDNPFDPFTQWLDWWNFDHSEGYCTCEYLDRVLKTSTDLSEERQDYAIDEAMNEIVKLNPGMYKIVSKNK